MILQKSQYQQDGIKQEKYHKLSMLLFFLLSLTFTSAQKKAETDKLQSQEKQENTQFNFKNVVNSAADSLLKQSNAHIRKGEFTKALEAAQQSLDLNKASKNDRTIGNSLNKIATIKYYQGQFVEALFYYDESINSYQAADFREGIASSTNNKGAIYYYLGNYTKALEHYKKAAEISAALDDKKQSAATIQNIGGIYVELEDFENAMKHFQMAKETYENIADRKALSQVMNGIGEIHLRKLEYDKANINFDRALLLAREINDQQSILEVLLNYGELYESQGHFKNALQYYHQSKDLAGEINNVLYQSLSRIAIGSANLKLGKADQAISHCIDGLKIAKEIRSISVQKEACDCLYNSYKSSRHHAIALTYLEQSIVLQDSLNARQAADEILNMQFEKQLLMDSIAHAEKRQRLERIYQEDIRQKEKQRDIFIVVGVFMIVIALGIWSRLNYVRKSKLRLQKEKDRSEHLLLNILPAEIAEELKEKGYVNAQNFETAAILFTDFKSFTATASTLSPQELVQELNICFKAFDIIIDQYNIEKIKTIGDAYMAVGGVPKLNKNSVKNTIYTALDMQEFILDRKAQNATCERPSFDMRVGIHAGPIVAGIVGVKKFQYDIWGDTVNTASRMESNCEVGRVNISRDTYLLVMNDSDLHFEYRGKIHTKGKGEIEMYYVSKKAQPEKSSTQDMRRLVTT